ncbi:MAG TPA: hypothetical protein P5544_14160 [Candidatus Nanopelagicales bacterium]|jgi:hypothetical protein|nr:hypothetical protein [Candidatus Nanopelagicales bacterium]
MNPWVKPAVSFGVGIVLALFGVIGGLGAMTSAKTAPEASQSLVAYDAR